MIVYTSAQSLGPGGDIFLVRVELNLDRLAWLRDLVLDNGLENATVGCSADIWEYPSPIDMSDADYVDSEIRHDLAETYTPDQLKPHTEVEPLRFHVAGALSNGNFVQIYGHDRDFHDWETPSLAHSWLVECRDKRR